MNEPMKFFLNTDRDGTKAIAYGDGDLCVIFGNIGYGINVDDISDLLLRTLNAAQITEDWEPGRPLPAAGPKVPPDDEHIIWSSPDGSVRLANPPLTDADRKRARELKAAKLAAAPVASDAQPTPPCAEPVAHLIAGASWFPCALPKWHDGGHRAAGNCYKHGPYLGQVHAPPQCPKWPDCVQGIQSAAATLGAQGDGAESAEQFDKKHGHLTGAPSMLHPGKTLDPLADWQKAVAYRFAEAYAASLREQLDAANRDLSFRADQVKALAEDNVELAEKSESLAADIQRLREGGWISVKERLPEMCHSFTQRSSTVKYSDDVLIYEDGVHVGSYGQFHDDAPGWSADEGSSVKGVTHWQPLPASPGAPDTQESKEK